MLKIWVRDVRWTDLKILLQCDSPQGCLSCSLTKILSFTRKIKQSFLEILIAQSVRATAEAGNTAMQGSLHPPSQEDAAMQSPSINTVQ